MTNSDGISLDNVLNTGVGDNQEQISTKDIPKVDANGNPIVDNSEEGNKNNNTPPSNKPPITDDNGKSPEEIEIENKGKVKQLVSSYNTEDNLSDEQKLIRTQLLEKYKGSNFDEQGNIIDEQGNIITPFDDIYKYVSEDKTTIDSNGNQVDEDGTIIKTKVELAVENTVVNKLHAESEFEFQDENGNTKIYSDDDAGIKEFTNDVSAQRFSEFKDEFFSQNPELTEIAKHILGGGTLDTFKQDVDYSQIDGTKLDKNAKLNYIKQSFLESGLDADRAQSLTDLILNSNSVDEEYDKAIIALEEAQVNRNSKRDLNYQQQVQEQQQAMETYWNEIETVVTKGDLGDISIPKEDREDFYSYLSTPVDDKGNSLDAINAQKETKEQKLIASYLRYKGHDLSKLVNAKVRKEKIKGLKELMRQSARITQAPVNETKKSVTSGGKDITISSLLP